MLLTAIYLLDRYGPVMSEEEIAGVLKYEPKSLQNMIYTGRLPLTPIPGLGKRRYHTEDVARVIDSMRSGTEAVAL